MFELPIKIVRFLSIRFSIILSNLIGLLSSKLLGKKIILLNPQLKYDDYILRQKEKTLDPKKIEKWLGEEWKTKLDGFRDLFQRNIEFIDQVQNCICLGARTGQEVVALKELGKDAIGIDLVEFSPHTIVGDIHNLSFDNCIFDLAFTNIFDHSFAPSKFISEIERVIMSSGFIIINLQLKISGDKYSENVIYDPNGVIELFKDSKLIRSHSISNTFDGMNWEIVMQKK